MQRHFLSDTTAQSRPCFSKIKASATLFLKNHFFDEGVMHLLFIIRFNDYF